jgi:hypothetical protein
MHRPFLENSLLYAPIGGIYSIFSQHASCVRLAVDRLVPLSVG